MMTRPVPLASWLSVEQHAEQLRLDGWTHFAETCVGRQIEWFASGGFHRCRFVLYHPGLPSNDCGGAFDQWLSEDPALVGLRDEFADAWGPVVEAGHEVICYLGPLRWIDPQRDPYNALNVNNPRFAQLTGEFRAGEWLARAFASVAPALAARCSIAFEGHAELTLQHPATHLAKLLQSMGTQCYVEPIPPLGADSFAHWNGCPRILTEEPLERYHSRNVGGELVQRLSVFSSTRETMLERIRRTLQDGSTAAFPMFGVSPEVGIADLGIECADLITVAADALSAAD